MALSNSVDSWKNYEKTISLPNKFRDIYPFSIFYHKKLSTKHNIGNNNKTILLHNEKRKGKNLYYLSLSMIYSYSFHSGFDGGGKF